MIILFCCIAGFIFFIFAWALCRMAARPTPFTPNPRYYFSRKRLERYRAKRRTYAEGRPTMPSEVEPELERERRTR